MDSDLNVPKYYNPDENITELDPTCELAWAGYWADLSIEEQRNLCVSMFCGGKEE